MIINTTQGNIEFNLPTTIKNVGIRLSGGCDSAIIGYLLAKYVKEERPDISLVAISLDVNQKSFQILFAKKVIEFIENEFNIKFKAHHTGWIEDQAASGNDQVALCDDLLNRKEIDCYYTGLTRNPPMEEMKLFTSIVNGLDITNNSGLTIRTHAGDKPTAGGHCYFPLINIDKRGVAELYEIFGLTDRLFPLTRSCEFIAAGPSQDPTYLTYKRFESHCEDHCWQCNERFWGFGRYE